MFVNSDKTKVVHFRSLRKPVTLFKFSYGDMNLEIVKSCNYLGVKFEVLKHALMLLLKLLVKLCPSVNNTLMWDIIHII